MKDGMSRSDFLQISSIEIGPAPSVANKKSPPAMVRFAAAASLIANACPFPTLLHQAKMIANASNTITDPSTRADKEVRIPSRNGTLLISQNHKSHAQLMYLKVTCGVKAK